MMLAIATVTGGYTLYFIIFAIPALNPDLMMFKSVSIAIFFKIVSVIILYVSVSTIITHTTALNAVVIRPESLEFRFLVKKNIVIPWDRLQKMEIFKVITHYWRTTYTDHKGETKTYKTSLAFPSVMKILLSIQDHHPNLEMNDMLKQVLLYKRTLAEAEKELK